MKRNILLLLAVFTTVLGAQEAEPPKPHELSADEKTVSDAANAYMEAYNKKDSKALAAMFDEQAQWVDDEGTIHSGKEAIAAMLEEALKDSPGRTLDIDVNSARALTPGVLVETGTTTVTEGDGSSSVGSYTAVHVQKDGKWLIAQLTETAVPVEGSATVRLMDLDWLIGTWEDKSDDADVQTTVNWTPSRSFITRAFTVKRPDGTEEEGTEVIGWDPSISKIRSWIFESDGGISENVWTQDGKRWLVQARTILPDGSQATAQHTLTKVDADHFTWSSANREVDGELLPNIDAITIVRSK